MDWQAAVALFSLALSTLTVYLAFKGRSDPYKEKVYSKQLDVYGELAKGLTEFSFDLVPTLAEHDFHLDDDSKRLLEQQTEEFLRKYLNWSLFLPMQVSSAVLDFVSTTSAALASREDLRAFPRQDIAKKVADADNPLGAVIDAWMNVFYTANICLGIEPLSQETASLARDMPWAIIQARLERSSFRRRS